VSDLQQQIDELRTTVNELVQQKREAERTVTLADGTEITVDTRSRTVTLGDGTVVLHTPTGNHILAEKDQTQTQAEQIDWLRQHVTQAERRLDAIEANHG
jgi:hypothetical protein